MENYSYASYAESGDSSPRSREVDFENPPPWEDSSSPAASYKVKFMCSYGGKIQPRSHDNQLSYIGGETKILSVDRSVKLASFLSKLAALSEAAAASDVSFKYQLPGEDLDALISVTNDDDLEHMMTEYDRLYRASAKPARLRLFIVSSHPSSAPQQPTPPPQQPTQGDTKSERDRFVDALNTAPADAGVPVPLPTAPAIPVPPPNAGGVDYLFGFEKGAAVAVAHPPPPSKIRDPASDPVLDRSGSPDSDRIPVDIQRHIHDLQRLQLQDQAIYARRKGEAQREDLYAPQKLPEKVPPPPPPQSLPITHPTNVHAPQGYWQEKYVGGGGGGGFQPPSGGDQPMYMIPATAGLYHAPPPVGRPMAAPGGQAPPPQGYYQVQQRAPPDAYREQQQATTYNMFPAAAAVAAPLQQQQQQAAKVAYTEGIGMGRPVADMGYAQVAYDSAGRQVYYTGPGGMMAAPYPGMAAVSADMRQGHQESKVSPK